MARQSGLIKIEGDMGGITFYKTKDGFLAREKTTISRDKLKSDPAFERTRENNAEFTRAAKAAQALINAFRNITVGSKDGRVFSRLLRETMRAVKADPVNDRGQRNVLDGELGFVQGFDFNSAGELSAVLKAQYTTAIDRAGGTLGVSVQPFIPSRMIIAPEGATHFRLISSGVEINFETGEYIANVTSSAEQPLNNDEVNIPALECLITPGSTRPLFLAFGIEFLQFVNKKYYGLKNGTFNSISIVAVNTPQ